MNVHVDPASLLNQIRRPDAAYSMPCFDGAEAIAEIEARLAGNRAEPLRVERGMRASVDPPGEA